MYRVPRRLTLSLLAVLLVAAVASAGCGTASSGGDGHYNFQTAVAADRNYDIYWLGRSFNAGRLVFTGPQADDFSKLDGGGLDVSYSASTSNGGCCGTLYIGMYSRTAWELIQPIRAPARRMSEAKTVTVNGRSGDLQTTRYGVGFPQAGDVSYRALVLDFGNTIVEAATSAPVPATPTDPQPNPLIDEATFLAVMQNLRPYPE